MKQGVCSCTKSNRWWTALFRLSWLVLSVPVGAFAQGEPEALALLRKSEALMRGGGSEGVYRVRIVRPEWQRELRLRSIDDPAGNRARLEMLTPRKVRGTLFLKRGGRLGMYLPKLRREVAISPAMMHDPWMGSDFNNQDLIESSALIDQYEHRILGREGRVVTIESTPKPDATVSWQRLEQAVRDDGLPLQIRFRCKNDERVRTLDFEAPKPLGGRLIPSRWVMRPRAHPGWSTTIEVEEIRFDIRPSDALFDPAAAAAAKVAP